MRSSGRLAALIVVGLMVIVWAVRVAADDNASTGTTERAEPPALAPATDRITSSPGADRAAVAPLDDISGVPVGYPRSEHGAVAAAVNWVGSFPTLMAMGPLRLTDTLRQLVSGDLAVTGIDEALRDRLALADEFGVDDPRLWLESPLQAVLVESSESSASVQVWAALTTGDLTEGPVEVLWRTHTIDLVWERNDWRIDHVAVVEGPTPVPVAAALPSPPSDFAKVGEWEPAVLADVDGRGK